MHPAYSVIFFTTASGAGYGLIALLAIFALAGVLPASTSLGFMSIGLSVLLISAGLLSSTFHLGRPERAWRAFSQWRSSWLAREGVAALATFAPIAMFGAGWVVLNDFSGPFAVAAVATVCMTLITVCCTGMIYASLGPIRQWRDPLTTPVYVTLAAATGADLLMALTAVLGAWRPVFAETILGLSLIGLAMKLAYWRRIDAAPPLATLGEATGLQAFGEVRLLEMPHTEENFIMREMGYQVARKHALKLRKIAVVALFGAPMVLATLTLWLGAAAAAPLGLVSLASAALGVGVERWLFFAEATHTSMLYYGRTA